MIGLKKYRLVTLLGILLVVISASQAHAQVVKKVGTSAATFLRIPVGVRGTAMGSAFVSIADDASAMFWNPGGIARIQKRSFFVDYSSWLPGLTFNYFGLVLPFEGIGSIGLNVTALTSDDIEVTTIDQPMGTGETFNSNSTAIGVAYARNLTDRFSIGVNVKFIHESILNSSANGIAFDIGTLYDTPFSGVRLGVSISNFGSDMRIDGEDLNIRVDIAPGQNGNNQSVVGRLRTDNFNAPLIMRVGLSWDAIKRESNRFTIAVDGLNPNDNAQSLNVGGEYALFKELLVLRAGFNDLFLDDREKGLTLGAGINWETSGGLEVSGGYAYQDFKNLGSINRFSISIKF